MHQSPLQVVIVCNEMKDSGEVLNAKVHLTVIILKEEGRLMGTSELVNHVVELTLLLVDGDIHANEDAHTRTPFTEVLLCKDRPVQHVKDEAGQRVLDVFLVGAEGFACQPRHGTSRSLFEG